MSYDVSQGFNVEVVKTGESCGLAGATIYMCEPTMSSYSLCIYNRWKDSSICKEIPDKEQKGESYFIEFVEDLVLQDKVEYIASSMFLKYTKSQSLYKWIKVQLKSIVDW